MRVVAAHHVEEDWSYHTGTKMEMDWPHSEETCLSLEWNPRGLGGKADQRSHGGRTIQQEHENFRMPWNQVKRTAQNRVRWKAAVGAYALD